MAAKKDNFFVVGIGSSADGVEALQVLVKNTNRCKNAGFIILHQSHENTIHSLHEQLADYTSQPILEVNKDFPIQPGHIYLIHNRQNIVIEDGYLKLREAPQDILEFSTDVFFQRIGLTYKEKAVAVVLSGKETDGCSGIKTIKEKGGIIFVQAPINKEHDEMSSTAIETGLADFVLPPDMIGTKIQDLMLLPDLYQTDYSQDLPSHEKKYINEIIREVYHTTNINFDHYRKSTILRRITKRMHILHYVKIEDYYQFLKENNSEAEILGNEFLIGVSEFFRDPPVWETFRQQVIPALFSRERDSHLIRVWVPGCSTGEEAYTTAILLQEYLEANKVRLDYKIFATDIDHEAIKTASKGIFGPDIINNLSEERLNRFFTPVRKSFKIDKGLREKLVFAKHDILSNPPFIHMDIISCRNTLIYIEPHSQKKIIRNFLFSLNKDAYLILGKSESLGELQGMFTPISEQHNIFKNKGTFKDKRIIKEKYSLFTTDEKFSELSKNRTTELNPVHDVYTSLLAEQFAPDALFIDQYYQIVYIHGNAGTYLTLPQKHISFNLLGMLEGEELTTIRSGIAKAFRHKTTVIFENFNLKKGNQNHHLDLKFRYLSAGNEKSLVLIEFHKTNKQADAKVQSLQMTKPDSRIKILQAELQEKEKEVLELQEQIDAIKENIQSKDEEFLASNEELQSSNEELQSVNEELFTVNNELQRKIEELTKAHHDINHILASANIITIFLDSDLNIRFLTPNTNDIINVTSKDMGRSIAHFTTNLIETTLFKDIVDVINTGKSIEHEVTTKNGRHFLNRVLPYKIAEEKLDGVVITFVDISEIVKARKERKKIENKIRENNSKLNLVLEASQTGIWEWDMQSNEIIWDEKTKHIFGYFNKEFDHKIETYLSRIHPEDVDKLKKAIEDTIKYDKPFKNELRVIWDDQSIHHVIRHGTVIRNADGEAIKMVGTCMDITDIIQKDEKIRSFGKLIEESYSEIFIFDAKTLKFIDVNLGARKNLGYSMEELSTMTPLDLKPAYTMQTFQQLIQPLYEGSSEKITFETYHLRKDSTTYHVLVNLQLSTYVNREVFIANIQDITPLKEAQKLLQISEERLEFAIKGTSDGVWDWPDINSNYVWWSPKFYELLGMKDQEIESSYENFIKLLHPEDKSFTDEELERSKKNHESIETEFRLLHKKEGYKWFINRAQVFADKEGKAVRMAGAISDIHQRKIEEFQYSQTNQMLLKANEYLDNFVFSVAHDLRAPVANLKSLVELFKAKINMQDPIVSRIDLSVERLEKTLNGMIRILDVQKAENKAYTRLNFNDILNKLKKEAANIIEDAHVLIEADFKVTEIDYVEPYLESIMRQLISNAIRYAKEEDPSKIYISTQIYKDFVILEVTDNGIGIDLLRFKEKIFKPFERLSNKSSGLGIGLPLIKTMVEKNGGKVEVFSKLHESTTFKVYLKPY